MSSRVDDDRVAVIVAALTEKQRIEMAEMSALLVRYREFIEDHGLTPPDDSGAEALERFRHMFILHGLDDRIQHPELLAEWWGGQRRRWEKFRVAGRPGRR